MISGKDNGEKTENNAAGVISKTRKSVSIFHFYLSLRD